MATGALAAKQQTSKSRTAKATKPVSKTAKSKTAKPAAEVAKPAEPVPLPDRNPNRIAASASAPASASAEAATPVALPAELTAPVPAELTRSIVAQPLPHEVPAATTTKAAAKATGIPLPERKPQIETKSVAAQAIHMPDPSLLAPVPLETPVPPKPVSNSTYARILAPLLDYEISPSDAANLKTAFGASYRGDDAGAHAAVARIKDTAARKLATWFEYRNGDYDASAEAIEEFRLANPQWPGQEELRERAEIALFLADASPERVRAFLGPGVPLTGAGKAALAGAYLKENNEPAARDLIISAWRNHQLNLAVEKKILDRYGSMLTKADHQARIDKLLFPDSKASADIALRTSKLLPAAEQKKVAARIAVVKRGANAGKLLDAIPASATTGDFGLLYNRIQWLRRKDRDQEAWKMLLDVPDEPDRLIDAEGWWNERRLNCRTALNAGQARIAYDIAAKHGQISGDAYVEAEFLAGWIALRFLGETETALGHFLALRAAAKGSKNIALAEYWLGRTALALGDNGVAVVHFHAAAKFPQYFYGQLGRQALDARPANLAVTPTPKPTEAEIQSFLANDAVRAIGVARAAGMDGITPQFFLALARKLTNPGEMVLCCSPSSQRSPRPRRSRSASPRSPSIATSPSATMRSRSA
jgi:soluble lytic murein transglycosylase